MKFRDNKLFSNQETIGRYSKYELFVEDYKDLGLEELNKQLKKALNEKNPWYNVPWKHGHDPRLFIVPAKDAVYQEIPVNSFSFYPDILLDFIDMGKKIHEDNSDYPNLILNFCNQYGLFNVSGFYSITFGTAEEVDHDSDGYYSYKYDWVLLSEAGMKGLYSRDGSSSMMHIHDFIGKLFPESWPGYHTFIKDKDNLHAKLSNNFYCESVRHAWYEIIGLSERFMEWFDFIDINGDPMKYKDDLSEYLMTNPLSVTIDYNRGWKLKWVYKSLFEALNIMFLNNIVESNQSIRLCENCNSAFIAGKQNQKYCDSYCNDAARSRRYYNKHKKKNQGK